MQLTWKENVTFCQPDFVAQPVKLFPLRFHVHIAQRQRNTVLMQKFTQWDILKSPNKARKPPRSMSAHRARAAKKTYERTPMISLGITTL